MNWLLRLFLLLIITSCSTRKQPPDTYHARFPDKITGALADSAMVVTAHPVATRVGVEILKQGGNAIDAAIAVQFALAVVYPEAGNIGGGGFMVVRMNDGKKHALDFREKAPAAATRNMYLDSTGTFIDSISWYGHLAVGVPGTVAGMEEAHQRLAKLSWESLLAPAINIAEEGYFLTEKEASKLNRHLPAMEQINTVPPAIFLGDWQEGDTIFNGDLAETLRLISEKGKAGFYAGEVADKIVAEMERGGGIISHQDLLDYEAKWREPVTGRYKDYNIISMPPPSSGGVALLQLLKMVENYPLQEWGWNAASTAHIMAEAERRVYADRAKYLGDPDFLNVPVEQLLEEEYLEGRMKTLQMARATPSSEIAAGTLTESVQTTHFSIVDQWGNAVSLTTTLNGSYGSKVLVDGAGFFLNNEMDDFSAKPGVPNAYGLVGGEANAIEPGKRMLSSMTPTIVEKDGELFMVVGTPGGATIITSVFQTILNVVEFDLSMQEAVSAPRFHHQWLPDQIAHETEAFDEQTRATLEKIGHTLVTRNAIGRVDAILTRENGELEGGADFRGDDTALGF